MSRRKNIVITDYEMELSMEFDTKAGENRVLLAGILNPEELAGVLDLRELVPMVRFQELVQVLLALPSECLVGWSQG